MAVTRPLKEGSVTTYQAKVAAGYPDILASEMDADLDTIYAAWNAGVGTGDIGNGSVTYAKLAPDAQLWRDTGTALTPGTSFATRTVALAPVGNALQWGSATVKSRLVEAAVGDHQWRFNANAANAMDDATKASWAIRNSATADNLVIFRAPPAATAAYSGVLTIDAAGILTLGKTGAGDSLRLGLVGTTTQAHFAVFGAGATAWASNCSISNVIDDATKPSWQINLGNGDFCNWYRAPAGSTAFAQTMVVDGGGNFQIFGAAATKASGTTWANPSDPRLKDDVAPYARGLSDILSLEPITYRLKADPDGPTCYGFDAARVRDVFPECVSEMRMKLNPDDEEETEGVLSFDLHPILVALVNAVKELAARR